MFAIISPIQRATVPYPYQFQDSDLNRDRILAAIDVGTNSIHMVVVKVKASIPAFTIIDKEKETVRLGDFAEDGNLSQDAMERGIDALKRCRAIAESFRAEDIVAVATSAVREAKNGPAFLERVKLEVGLGVNLISGTEEARRIYLGVLSGMEFHGRPHAVVDIGGGSTELLLGTGEVHRFLSSTKVGAVRLTAGYVSSDPISDEEFTYLSAYVRGRMEPTVEDLKRHLKPGETLQLVGTSGTAECLASLVAYERLGVVPDPLNGFRMSLEELQTWVERLRKMTLSERLDLPEISERRAEIIVAGAIILQETMKLLGADDLVICERALREGVVVDWMLTHGLIEDRMQFQGSVRERSVRATAEKYHVPLEAGDRVADFVLALFDASKGHLHNWDNPERELLWAAAILHNSGHYISHSSHHKHSYYLIRNGELLGYTEAEIEVIANIARYHRKSLPKKKHDNFRGLTTKYHRQVVIELSAMLRVAVALDRRGIGAIKDVQYYYDGTNKTLHLDIRPSHPFDDCASELWNLEDKKLWFEDLYSVKLVAHLV
ncbi:Ppx/GppA phosphatase family protein [Oscillatoria sp. CS-180]|uniref:Ppx/GppA phosphatase family protein n=1 Tax=Oscillatoria sp. CS-180 TaxID=3021720 RepID=UPI00232A9CFB|nr:Ppx/GppA phosphatase family protein [Oscillatoria sp. CS-180]MDB9529099.1 Ppx/GppA phosphatase family protein [Oscillatoria sp. CS-180]